MEITYHLSQFDGPLDMLLFMLDKAKIDIRDIFISEITDQYIKAVENADELDMDEASAFITVAARLLEIKSHKLLPRPPAEEEEEDPEAAFIRQLEEYAAFKQIAADMQSFEHAAALVYHKLPEEYPLPPPSFELTGLTMEGLINAFARVLARKPKDEEENQQTVRRIIRDEHTVPACMAHILRRVRRGSTSFLLLMSEEPSREEVVTLFLALLELLKLGKISFAQEGIYGDITVSAA